MTNTKDQELDSLLTALANKRRREIVYMLALRPASIKQLADKQQLSLPAIHRHVKVLEAVGLVIRKKSGRTNFLALDSSKLAIVQAWFFQFNAHWGSKTQTLENYVAGIENSNKL